MKWNSEIKASVNFFSSRFGICLPRLLNRGLSDHIWAMWGHKQLICVPLPWQAATFISSFSHKPSESLSTSARGHFCTEHTPGASSRRCSCTYKSVPENAQIQKWLGLEHYSITKKGVYVHFPLIEPSQEQLPENKTDIQEIPQLRGFKTPA